MRGRARIAPVAAAALLAAGAGAFVVMDDGGGTSTPRPSPAGGSPSPTVAASGPARLAILDPTVSMGERTGSVDARIANRGAEPLTWRAREDVPWLSVVPARGRLDAGEIAAIRISADRSGLDPGRVRASVLVDSDGGDAAIAVRATVGRVPLLIVPSPVLQFPVKREGTQARAFQIRNGGHAPLEWNATTSKGFAALTGVTEGTLVPGAFAMVQVTFDYDEAFIGRREAVVTIASNGGDGTVTVVGTADRQSPKLRDADASRKHEHCAGSSCDRYVHLDARVTDDFSTVVSARVQYQICGTHDPAATRLTCGTYNNVEMTRVRGSLWRAEVRLPDCPPGYGAYMPWRVYMKDSSGNFGVYPGTNDALRTRVCDMNTGPV